MGVYGSWLIIQGVGFMVYSLWFGVKVFGLRVSRCGAQGSELRVSVLSFGRGGLAFGVCGLGLESCITQLKAQGPSRTCNESKDEEGV